MLVLVLSTSTSLYIIHSPFACTSSACSSIFLSLIPMTAYIHSANLGITVPSGMNNEAYILSYHSFVMKGIAGLKYYDECCRLMMIFLFWTWSIQCQVQQSFPHIVWGASVSIFQPLVNNSRVEKGLVACFANTAQ